MRTINASEITEKVRELCISANKVLPHDLICRIDACSRCESSQLGRSIFDDMKANIAAAIIPTPIRTCPKREPFAAFSIA